MIWNFFKSTIHSFTNNDTHKNNILRIKWNSQNGLEEQFGSILLFCYSLDLTSQQALPKNSGNHQVAVKRLNRRGKEVYLLIFGFSALRWLAIDYGRLTSLALNSIVTVFGRNGFGGKLLVLVNDIMLMVTVPTLLSVLISRRIIANTRATPQRMIIICRCKRLLVMPRMVWKIKIINVYMYVLICNVNVFLHHISYSFNLSETFTLMEQPLFQSP